MASGLFADLGLRYLRSDRRSLRFVTRVAALGLVISVGTLLLVQGVLAGFEREMRERVLRVLPHVSVHVNEFSESVEDLEKRLPIEQGVVGVSKAISGNGLLVASDRVRRVSVTGIDPETVTRVSSIGEHLDGARIADLDSVHYGVLLGIQLARSLGVEKGESVTLVLSDPVVSLAGVFPRQKRLTVLGFTDTKSLLDEELAYVHIRDAERLFRHQRGAKAWHFRTADPLTARQLRWRLRFLVGPDAIAASDWTSWLGPIYEAIVVQKLAFLLIFSMFVAVAAFNLVSGLVLVVHESAGEIAILRSLGARASTIVGIFLVVGTSVAILGAGGGVVVALILGTILEWLAPWIDRVTEWNVLNQYLIHDLPVEFLLGDVVRVVAIAMALCFAATIYPALRASAARPAEVLRHE